MSAPRSGGRDREGEAAARTPVGLSTWQIFRVPVWLGLLSAVGLLSALLGDGLWDGLSWLSLSAPLAVSARHIWWRPGAGQPRGAADRP